MVLEANSRGLGLTESVMKGLNLVGCLEMGYSMCIYVYIYWCIYVYVCVYMCIYVYIYVIICVYITCIYTYTRIYIFQSVRGIFLRCVTLNSWVYPYVICMVSPFLLFWWTCELGVWINVDFLQQCEKTGPQTTAQTLAVFCPKDISGL